MNLLAKVHIYCFLLSYLIALGLELMQYLRGRSAALRALTLISAAAGFLAHTVFLISHSQKSGLPPLLASQQDWLLVLAWLGGLLYLILLWTHHQHANGLFMLPAMILLIIVAIFVSNQSAGNLKVLAQQRWGMFHATSLVLGIGAVLGATISGLMYLLHHQRLRSRSGWLQKLSLPSLENLTAMNRWMVVFSFPCLTIGLLTGFLLITWRKSEMEPVHWTDPTIVTTVIVWLAMVVLLVRLLSSTQQSGKAVAQLSLLSGGFLLVTVLGPMLLSGSGKLNTFHGRPAEAREQLATPDNGRTVSPAEPQQ